MKKILSLSIVLMLMLQAVVFADAESSQYSDMTTENLQTILDNVRNELFLRSIKLEPDQVFYDDGSVKVYLTGKWEYPKDIGLGRFLRFEICVINQSDVKISLEYDKTYINGWEVGHVVLGKVEAGKKKKLDLVFKGLDADLQSAEEVDEVEFQFTVYNAETKKPIKTVPVMIYPNK